MKFTAGDIIILKKGIIQAGGMEDAEFKSGVKYTIKSIEKPEYGSEHYYSIFGANPEEGWYGSWIDDYFELFIVKSWKDKLKEGY